MLVAGQSYFDAFRREQRFNPNHDDRGRFTFGDGTTGNGGGPAVIMTLELSTSLFAG